MPILFGTLAALVMAIAAWTTYKNQDEYKHQISLREKQESNLDKNIREEEGHKIDLVAEQKATKDLEEANVKLAEDLQKKLSEMTTLNSAIKTKERQILDIKSEVDANKNILKDLGDVETLVPKIKRIKSEIAQLEDDIEKEEANLTSLKQVSRVTQSEIDVKVGEAERIAQGKSQATLATSIKTVYSSWGFVTLNGGDIQGVVPDSTLDVVRDGEVVAKLKVTTVEPNRAAADIVRDSLKDEYFLRSGDRVVAESESGVKAKSNTKSTPRPATRPTPTAPVAPNPAALDDPPAADPAPAVPTPTDDPF